MKRNLLKVLIMIGVLLNTAILPSQAATPQQIEDSIQKGLDWLVPQQQTDGSWAMWGWYQVGATGFAVSKLEDRAYELGYSSPFDANYPYQQNVADGLNYIFSRAVVIGPGIGFSPADEETYQTGIALMAIVGSRTPNTIVNVGNPVVDGLTYKQVAQAIVDYFVASQNPDGGWRYYMSEQPSDNSCSGFAVLGLRYAEAPLYGFQCNIPSSVTSGLNNWIDAIQAADGGSEYTVGGGWENLLKTGNLLFEMSFVDDDMLTQRTQDALSYIQNHWNDNNSDPGWRPSEYLSMYCMMKGFQSMGIDSIDVDGNQTDWFNEFADAILDSQQADGSWPSSSWSDSVLSTCWALLTLEKAAPPPPVNVVVDLPICACDVAGYSVGITYTVERFTVDGTLQVFEDDVLVDTVDLDNFNGTDTYTRNIASDDPGAHVWKGVLDVTSVGGGTPAHAEDTGSVNVCESPKVAGIPDQIAPFQSFDLDDYLTYNGGLPVIWTYSGAPEGWTVAVDTNNMVTVTAPLGASTPVTITFTASVTCPPCNTVCKGSDDVLFTPNRPPDCSNAYADHSCLWPPNHKFANINIKGVSDPDGDPVAVTITSITSDESTASDKGSGGAKHSPDAIIAGASKASVRAERSGNSDGRVYVINFTASDEKGSECNSSVTVKVPHDQSSKTCSAVDSGQDYDATAIN